MYEPLLETTGTKAIETEVFTYHDSSVFRKNENQEERICT